MVNHIIISWLDAKDETRITFTGHWDKLHPIDKLDCLQDALKELTEYYNKKLDNLKSDVATYGSS